MAVLATAVWRVRPSGSNTNGGGFDTGIAGHATDYSQQNAAQATGTNGAGSATTTFTDATASAFTSAMVGNAINITGQGFYFVTAFISATQVTVDRALGTFSGATWHLGGGWADFWTNTTSSGPLVANNIVYILGSGTPNPAAYVYDYTAGTQFTVAANPCQFQNDPATPGYLAPPNTTGGMPVIKFNVASSLVLMTGALTCQGLWFVGTTTAAGNYVFDSNATAAMISLSGCVLDQFSFDVGLIIVRPFTNGQGSGFGCEVFSSVAPGAAGSQSAFAGGTAGGGAILFMTGCNIHDCVGIGVSVANTQSGVTLINSIIAKCQSDGLQLSGYAGSLIQNCTIDGNLGNGILFTSLRQNYIGVINNIISNHTGVGKFGVNTNAVSLSLFFDYNVYYNNTADLNNLSYGPHDTHGGSNPYVNQSTENYTLA